VINALKQSPSVAVAQESGAQTSKSRPNIFVIVLDGYGRSDVLKERYGLDNRPFIDSLKRHGFRVAEQATTNYVQTELSLASALNLDYIQALFPGVAQNSFDRRPLDEAISASRAAKRLKSLGYAYIGIATGFPYIRFQTADLALGGADGRQLIRASLLDMTPLPPSISVIRSMYDQRRDQLRAAFQNLVEVAKPTGKPKFVVAHILAPHPPFVFGPNGEPRRWSKGFQFVDGSHYMASGGTPESYRQGYADQATYLDKLVLEAVDGILRQSGPDTIIVIHGDHGPKMSLDQDSLKGTDVREVLPTLIAIRAPESVKVSDKMTNVNIYRNLFSSIFGDKLPPLEDRNYYSTWERPYDFVQVSETAAPR
jgi:hypothetical protein